MLLHGEKIAELYDSTAGTWFPTGNLITGRNNFVATLFQNGQILLAGGINCAGNVLSSELHMAPPVVGVSTQI